MNKWEKAQPGELAERSSRKQAMGAALREAYAESEGRDLEAETVRLMLELARLPDALERVETETRSTVAPRSLLTRLSMRVLNRHSNS